MASHTRSVSSDLAQKLEDLHLPTRYPEPERTRFFPRGKSPAAGHNWVRQERNVSLLDSGLEGSRLRESAHSVAWGQLRLELKEPCARSRRAAAAEEQRPTCLPHPRPARVRWLCLVLTVWVRDAGGARGRWAVVNRSPPAHSKWLPPIPPPGSGRAVAMGYQGGCHGLPNQGSGSMRGMAGACGLLSRGPWGWGLSYKEGPGKRQDPRAVPRRACGIRQHLCFSIV